MKTKDYFVIKEEVSKYYKKNINLNGVECGVAVDDMLNSFSTENRDAFVQYMTQFAHPTIQQNFFRMMMLAISEFAKKESYDGRNKASVEMAQTLVKLMEENGISTYLPTI